MLFTRRTILLLIGILTCFAVDSKFSYAATEEINRPNVLIIMADDCTYNDLPIYGGKNGITPNIDKLAKEGLVFQNAYLTTAMCQPCRAELFTGLFPMSNGCAWNHSASKPKVRSMPHYLTSAEYRVGLAGKVHVKPKSVFPFESLSGFDQNCVRNPTRQHKLGDIKSFIERNDKQPFCLVVALVEPHVPWVMGDPSKYPPEKIKLPPNIADTDRTREAFSRYLAEITYMDSQVGDILKTLDESGKSENTLVFFTSEQGSQFPGCKWTNWDTGLHTALISRWPGIIASSTKTTAMVHYADILPTIMEAASIKIDSDVKFDGSSFLKVLNGTSDSHRKYTYGMHNNLPEGPPFPIRTIFDGEFRYIQNLNPTELFIEKHLMGLNKNGFLNNPYWGTWIFQSQASPKIYGLVKRYIRRPKEQLYHTKLDPFELNNLASSDTYQVVLKKLKRELLIWRKSQDDPGMPQDTMKALKAARELNHLYGK